jgi:hypothetical protein
MAEPTVNQANITRRDIAGSALRDLAAILETIERDGLASGLDTFRRATPWAQQVMLSYLVRESLGLAHVVYGDDLSTWIEGFRRAGNAMSRSVECPAADAS